MTCYTPLKGWRSKIKNPKTGKRPIVFNLHDAFVDRPLTIPCGQCIGCRLARSLTWALRCTHEAHHNEDNCFITLTYDDEHLPKDGSVNVKHYQLFMKRLRKKYEPKIIRFFHCGEYGDNFGRPHYHAILFNHDFQDKKQETKNEQGDPLYYSQELTDLWGMGHTVLGAFTFETAAYVSRYIIKKITGPEAGHHYSCIDPYTGEIIYELLPEYTTMSRRPGIGQNWYDRYKNDVFPSDNVIHKGNRHPVPRYYADKYEISNPTAFKAVKRKRILAAKKHAANNTEQRLRVRQIVKESQIQHLKRAIE